MENIFRRLRLNAVLPSEEQIHHLKVIFEASKESYYETLEASSQGWHEAKHDVHPWLNYFWGVLIRAYKEFEERVGTITSGRGSKTDLIKAAISRRVGPFAISDIDSDCPGISRDMIRVVLRQMRDEGILITKGRGRGAKWYKGYQEYRELLRRARSEV